MSSNRALQRAKRLFGAAQGRATRAASTRSRRACCRSFSAPRRGSRATCSKRARRYRVVGDARLGDDHRRRRRGDDRGPARRSRRRTPSAIAAAASRFVGEIEQVPPMYSALKRDGVPLYRLARSGVEVERAPRRVVIEALVIDRYEWPALSFTVRCSKGTYVRTLVEDLAKAAGTLGHVAALAPAGRGPVRRGRHADVRGRSRRAANEGTARLGRPAAAGRRRARRAGRRRTRCPTTPRGWRAGRPWPPTPSVPCGRVKVYAESGQLHRHRRGDGRRAA